MTGKPIGVTNDNPIIDSSVYQVEFRDGTMSEYTANIIAENLYSQVDEYGEQYTFMDEIMVHRKTKDAIPKSKGYISVNGQDRMVVTTRGWKFQVRWKDGDTSWVNLFIYL